MKNLLTTTFLVFLSAMIYAQSFTVDPTFAAALVAEGVFSTASGTNEYNESDVNTIVDLRIDNYGITDLSGIEYFTDLEFLSVKYNLLQSLDLSNNHQLEVILCHDNNINNLTLSPTANILKLNASNNNLSALDVTPYTNLYYLNIAGNNFTNIDNLLQPSLTSLKFKENNVSGTVDLSSLQSLKNLDCQVNSIQSLILNPNAPIEVIRVHDNPISSLNIGNRSKLKTLTAWNNNLTSLDVSNSPNLSKLVCHSNQISSLDFTGCPGLTYLALYSNSINDLDISGISNLITLSAQNNPFTCIQVSQAQLNNIPAGWVKDAAASYSLICGPCTGGMVNIPDLNFENYLEDNNYGDGIYGNNLVPKDSICSITDLDVSSRNISDLTGIEEFSSLETLRCAGNNLTGHLDLSGNPNLNNLACQSNSISSLDITQNQNLVFLNCVGNDLISLVLPLNGSIRTIHANHNKLNNLQLNNNLDLKKLRVHANTNLVVQDLTNYSKMEELRVHKTNTSSLSLVNMQFLSILETWQSQISTIDISQIPSLWVFNWGIPTTCIQTAQNVLPPFPVYWSDNTNSQGFYQTTPCGSPKIGQFSHLEEGELAIYPNPFSNNLTLTGLYNMKLLQIMDMNGKEVLSEDINSVQMDLDLSALDKGIYILSLVSKDGTITREKIVKQ